MTLETHEVLEVAHIAAIAALEIDFEELRQTVNNGYFGVLDKLSIWSLEFYLKYKDVEPDYWEKVRDEQGDWDEIIVNYIKSKYES